MLRTLRALDTLERSTRDEHYHMVNIIRTSTPLGDACLLARLRLERAHTWQSSFGSLAWRTNMAFPRIHGESKKIESVNYQILTDLDPPFFQKFQEGSPI